MLLVHENFIKLSIRFRWIFVSLKMSIIKHQHTVAVLNTTSTVNDIFWPKCTSKTCFKLVASSYWISWSTFYLSNLIQYLAVFLLWHVDIKASFCQVRSIENIHNLISFNKHPDSPISYQHETVHRCRTSLGFPLLKGTDVFWNKLLMFHTLRNDNIDQTPLSKKGGALIYHPSP